MRMTGLNWTTIRSSVSASRFWIRNFVKGSFLSRVFTGSSSIVDETETQVEVRGEPTLKNVDKGLKAFYYLRHGSTNWSPSMLAQGALDLSLNTNGIEEALKSYEKLEKVGIQLILSSPLKRCVETAEIISKKLNESPIPVEIIKDLEERRFGDWSKVDSKAIIEIIEKGADYPNLFARVKTVVEKFLPDDGETEEIFSSRVIKAFNEIIQNQDFQDKIVLIVAHGCVYDVLRVYLNNGQDFPKLSPTDPLHFQMNTENIWTVKSVNWNRL